MKPNEEVELSSTSSTCPKVRILPKSQRAKNRVHEHGDIMLLKELIPQAKFLVESLEDTWHGSRWSGWFTFKEADYEEVL